MQLKHIKSASKGKRHPVKAMTQNSNRIIDTRPWNWLGDGANTTIKG